MSGVRILVCHSYVYLNLGAIALVKCEWDHHDTGSIFLIMLKPARSPFGREFNFLAIWRSALV
jgi:hypothetical protein